MQIRYDAAADRILWQVRTRSGELFAAWLTRRMLLQLWPPFQGLVGQVSLPPGTRPDALLMPEAREMLTQTARERPLPSADFSQPFDNQPAAQPIGPEPLLPTTVDLGVGPDGLGLAVRLREAGGRSLSMQLHADLASALLRLMDQALAESQWGIAAAAALAAPAGDTPATPRLLS